MFSSVDHPDRFRGPDQRSPWQRYSSAPWESLSCFHGNSDGSRSGAPTDCSSDLSAHQVTNTGQHLKDCFYSPQLRFHLLRDAAAQLDHKKNWQMMLIVANMLCKYDVWLTLMDHLSFRITYVQSSQSVPTTMPQQATPPPGSAYLPSPLATLGFTAITPAGQTLVQPIVGQPPLLAPAPNLSCQSQTPTGQASTPAGQVQKEHNLWTPLGVSPTIKLITEVVALSFSSGTNCHLPCASRPPGQRCGVGNDRAACACSCSPQCGETFLSVGDGGSGLSIGSDPPALCGCGGGAQGRGEEREGAGCSERGGRTGDVQLRR